jgi:hypothetical protein
MGSFAVKQITGQPAAQQCEVSPLPDDWFEDICDKETLPPSSTQQKFVFLPLCYILDVLCKNGVVKSEIL